MVSSNLFQPLKVGNMTLQHRIVMAPLTRHRAEDSHAPSEIQKIYYEQRASAPGTLIITEGTFISAEVAAYRKAPGLFTQEQLEAWKGITDAVHAKGSYMFVQLWDLGRATDKTVNKPEYNFPLKSSSAVPMDAESPVPEEMTEEEIQKHISMYATAAKAAVEVAGFDGVEIHGANGYLVDQFTQDVVNHRTDRWGGSIENRSRFAVEVAKAVSKAVGPERTAIRLSPFNTWQGMRMADPVPQFRNLISQLKPLNLAYLHVVESRIAGIFDSGYADSLDFVYDTWGPDGVVFLAGGFTGELAKKEVDNSQYANKAIVFGRNFIANPDLVFRLQNDIALNKYDRSTFYKIGSPIGYIDYPFSSEFIASQQPN